MRRLLVLSFIIANIIFLLFFNFSACNGTGDGSSSASYDTKHIDMTNTAISQWNIGMADGTISTTRNLGDGSTAYNPKNWSILSDEYCSGEGIPTSLQGANCPWQTNGSVIGVCQVRTYGSGEIADSTFVMRQTYQDSSADDLSKQVVYTHELGHCIGLRHSDQYGGNTSYVMWPAVNPLTGPHANELAAAAGAYTPVQNPTGTDTTGNRSYYTIYSGTGTSTVVKRQWSLPVVSTYPYSPRNPAPKGFKALALPKGEPLKGPVTEAHYYIKKDGRCDIKVINQDGSSTYMKDAARDSIHAKELIKNLLKK